MPEVSDIGLSNSFTTCHGITVTTCGRGNRTKTQWSNIPISCSLYPFHNLSDDDVTFLKVVAEPSQTKRQNHVRFLLEAKLIFRNSIMDMTFAWISLGFHRQSYLCLRALAPEPRQSARGSCEELVNLREKIIPSNSWSALFSLEVCIWRTTLIPDNYVPREELKGWRCLNYSTWLDCTVCQWSWEIQNFKNMGDIALHCKPELIVPPKYTLMDIKLGSPCNWLKANIRF